MNGDMAIIREWAEAKVSGRHFATDCDLKVARHILNTTTPPTMADMTEDEREACQWMQGRDESGDLLVIACVRWEHCDVIYRDGVTTTAMHDQITPLPGLPKLEWPAGEPAEDTPEPEDVPESTPDHPVFLETEEDYKNAPERTIVVAFSNHPWMKVGGFWGRNGVKYDAAELCGVPREVLRWGWEA